MPSTPDISFTLGDIDRAIWTKLAQDRPVPLQQHWAYGETLRAIGADISQLTITLNGTPVAVAIVGRRRFYRIVRMNSLMRGPLWLKDINETTKAQIFKALRRYYSPWRWNFLAFQPELADTPESRRTLKRAGYRRIMSGYSTIWMDLGPDEDTLRAALDGKWRNQLKKAEGQPLDITIGGKKQHHYSWLTDKEAEQQQARGYQAIPIGLVPIYAGIADRFAPGDDRCGVMSVTAIHKKTKVAGAIFLLHGNAATYHIGWNGNEGRDLNAQNRVLWEGIRALKACGVRFLDLGGINTADGAGIARFKLGLGCEPITLVGTWL